jgi:hypothetical protein
MFGQEYKRWEKRIMRYKPAVTKVEEWTKAEIGVGAAIAKGNQGEKGYKALLVIKVITIRRTRRESPRLEENLVKSL